MFDSVWRTPVCAGSVFISLHYVVTFIHTCTISVEFAGNEPVAFAQGHGIRQYRQPPAVAASSVALHARHIVLAQVPTAGDGRLRHAARFPGRNAVAQDHRLHRSRKQVLRHRQIIAG